MNENRILITHTDLDGVGCALVYLKCFPGAMIKFTDYDSVEDEVMKVMSIKDASIMLSDLSIKDKKLIKELDERGNFEMVDHHPTAKWIANKYPWALVDTKKSATMLMYELMSQKFIIKDLLPLVTVIDNYDMWGYGEGPTKEAIDLNRLLGIYRIGRFLDKFIFNSSPKPDKVDTMLLEIREEEINEYLLSVVKSASISVDAGGHRYAMITADRYVSEACHAVLKSFLDIDYVMSIDFINNKVSLRGRRGKVDLGMMAKEVGGGGHKQSAGFPIKHGSQLRMVLQCNGKCIVTEKLEAIINELQKPQ